MTWRDLPPVTLSILGVTTVLSLLGKLLVNDQGVVPFFAMLPGYTLPPNYYLWTLLTSGFFETSLINAIMNIALFAVIGKFVENIWGSTEFLKFVLVVQLFTNLSLLIILTILYGTTRSEIFLYGVDIHGMSAIMGGFLVVFKQLIPEHKLELGGFLAIRTKDGPLLSIFLFVVLYLIGLTRFSELLCCIFGVYVAWVYLRFFQLQGGKQGDRSETFQFATFFPERVRPLAVALATVVFRFLVVLKICKRVAPEDQAPSYNFRVPPLTAPLSGDSSDAERRRALAAAALEARLAQQPTTEKKGKDVTINVPSPAEDAKQTTETV